MIKRLPRIAAVSPGSARSDAAHEWESGETLTALAFRAWRERKAYTLAGAPKALGLSWRVAAYDQAGEKPIPGLWLWRRGRWR